jgi:hypothetical protein
MQYKIVNDHVERMVNIELTDAEPVSIKRWPRDRGFTILPESASIFAVNGQWSGLTIYGAKAKKDGTPSMNRASHTWSVNGYGDAYILTKAPEWVRELFANLGRTLP